MRLSDGTAFVVVGNFVLFVVAVVRVQDVGELAHFFLQMVGIL